MNGQLEPGYMDKIKKFLRNESGTAEAASVAVMIGAFSSQLWGVWYQISNDSSFYILAVLGGLLLLWLFFKH
jgi:hypothetical protein